MRRQDGGNDGGSSGWVNTDVAAEALGVSARSVRNYIVSGDLAARKEAEGINERYIVSVDSLYALRDRRKQEGKMPGNRRQGPHHQPVFPRTLQPEDVGEAYRRYTPEYQEDRKSTR